LAAVYQSVRSLLGIPNSLAFDYTSLFVRIKSVFRCGFFDPAYVNTILLFKPEINIDLAAGKSYMLVWVCKPALNLSSKSGGNK